MNTTSEAFESVVMARIRELWHSRSWWRQNRWADWPDIRRDETAELRSLVKLARMARKLAAAKPDPLDQFKSYHDWQSSAMAEAIR